jgi:two-component system chemotaxis sensor kinase CheA
VTRRIPVIRSISAPRDVVAAALAAFPGAVLVADGAGLVQNAWAGPTSPIGVDGAIGRALHAVLGLADDAPAAGQLQLWLACAVGVDSELFALSSADPPRHLPAQLGRAALELEYGPIFDGFGVTTAIVAFVKAAAHETEARPAAAEASTPEQVERFLGETQPLLDDCAAELAKLTADREARHAVHRMFRAIHTVKGAARAAGLGPIAALAHELEDKLAQLRTPGRAATSADLDVLRELLGQLGQQVLVDAPLDAVVDAMASLYGASRPLIARAEEAFTAWQTRPRDVELGVAFQRALELLAATVEPFRMRALAAQIASVIDLVEVARSHARPERRLLAGIDQQLAALHDLVELYQDVYREVRAQPNPSRLLADIAAARRGPRGGSGSMALQALAAREGLAAFGRALDGGGDPDRVAYLLEDLPRMFAPAPASCGARIALAAAQRTLSDAARAIDAAAHAGLAPVAATLRATAARLTWMPLDDVIRRARRQATSLAAELGKRVEVDVDAFGVVVPEAIHRVIGEALLHAVRNAVDHGLEPVDERVRAGKRATGTISIAVSVGTEGVRVEVVDDGRGVDTERVREKAIAAGLIERDAVLDARALHDLVFAPGLSTASEVGMVSGRGVGMDVIRSLAQEQGGEAELSSQRGRWTRLCVRLPLAAHARLTVCERVHTP